MKKLTYQISDFPNLAAHELCALVKGWFKGGDVTVARSKHVIARYNGIVFTASTHAEGMTVVVTIPWYLNNKSVVSRVKREVPSLINSIKESL